jgi:hypothetical protein
MYDYHASTTGLCQGHSLQEDSGLSLGLIVIAHGTLGSDVLETPFS